MNIKALITMLVLGSSSVAMARPVTVSGSVKASWTYGTAPAPIVRDHRTQVPARAPAYQTDHHAKHRSPPFVPVWTTLGAMNRVADGEMSFAVNPYASRFSMLKLQSSAGKSLIYRVKIQFANGRTQVVELNKYLMAGSPTITIDLAGEGALSIKNVTVVGRNARMSAYSVLAI